MSEVNLEELRENARTNYGITNAADLEADQLQSEMDAIDKQATDAQKEQAELEKNAETNNPNSTAPSTLGATNEDQINPGAGTGNENENEDQGKALSRQTKPELLETAQAENVEVEETDTVPVLREKIQAARDEAAEEDDEEEDQE